MSILTCDNVGYALGIRTILSDITFSVESGAKVGVIGVNGAGKTTLLSILTNAKETTRSSKRTSSALRSRPFPI